MDEKDAISSFLNEVSESKELFKEEQQEGGDSIVEERIEEKPLPFHKDPKVQRYVEKQVEKILRDKPSVNQQPSVAAPVDVQEVIGAFAAIIGNDAPEKVRALEALEKALTGADERASQKAIERFQKQQEEMVQRATEADTKAQEELDEYFEEIEESYNVDLSSNSTTAKAMRSQFIDYVRKIAPKDEHGEVTAFPDLLSAFEEFQERNKRPSQTRAKELANRGMERSGDTTTQSRKFVSGNGDPWKQVEHHFDNLKASN